MIVAIDGPAGAGKSTIAKAVANRLGFTYIDTGAMYRAIALRSLRLGVPFDQAEELTRIACDAKIELEPQAGRVLLDGEDVSAQIRTPEISTAASQVSAVPGVRRALVHLQREIADRQSVVMEGRDIGSVVFPHADVKIFLDADPHIRASRRRLQLGGAPDSHKMQAEIAERDARDRGRADSPLVRTPDAVYIDSTYLTPEQVLEAILDAVASRTQRSRPGTH